jgi:hypothetical protein
VDGKGLEAGGMEPIRAEPVDFLPAKRPAESSVTVTIVRRIRPIPHVSRKRVRLSHLFSAPPLVGGGGKEAWGARGPEFKSRRPDQPFQRPEKRALRQNGGNPRSQTNTYRLSVHMDASMSFPIPAPLE